MLQCHRAEEGPGTLEPPEAPLRWLLLVFFLAAQAVYAQVPILHVDRPRVDLGRIPADKPVDLVFRIANAGSAPLRVLNIEASCGCTTVDASGFVLAPGAQRILPVRLDPRGLNRVFRKSITLASDDTTQPNLELLIEGERVS